MVKPIAPSTYSRLKQSGIRSAADQYREHIGDLPSQQVILFTIITAAVLFLLLNYVAVVFEARAELSAAETPDEKDEQGRRSRAVWRENRTFDRSSSKTGFH